MIYHSLTYTTLLLSLVLACLLLRALRLGLEKRKESWKWPETVSKLHE